MIEIIKQTLAVKAKAIRSMGNELDTEVVGRIVSLLSNLKRELILTGAGTSGVVAKISLHFFRY